MLLLLLLLAAVAPSHCACPRSSELASICGAAKRASSGNCLVCMQSHFPWLCSNAQADGYCSDTVEQHKSVAINFAAPTGRLNFTFGTDRGPHCEGTPPFSSTNIRDDGVDASEALHAMGATVIRTHDSGVLDWEKLFPHPKLDVDTGDPSNYDFSAGDIYLRRIVDSGFEPYLRLGGFEFDEGGGLPPPGKVYNVSALVDVMLHIVMHYSTGWGGGNWTGRGIRYIEIWNEPDSSCSWHNIPSCGQFWNRSATDFYDLFDGIAKALKRYDSSLIVGGPGAALADEGPAGSPWPNPRGPNPYSFGLIDAVSARQTPIDFFSWHFYTDKTVLLTTIASAMRQKLDSKGLSHVTQHVTEWFTGMLNPSENTLNDAAAVAGILSRMVDAGVSLATLYPCCDDGQGQTAKTGWGLFDQTSHPGQLTWRPLTHSHAMFGELLRTAPMQLPVSVSPAENAFTAIAGRSVASDGGGALRVLISSQHSTSNAITVTVGGLGSDHNRRWRYSVSVLDSSHPSPATAAGGVAVATNGTLEISCALVPPAVALLRIDAL